MALEKLGIYIPSRRRSKVIMNSALALLPKKIIPRTYIVVGEEEFDKYRHRVPKKINVLQTPAKENIGAVRQWILENAKEEYVLFLSDDLQFGMREMGKLVNCKMVDIEIMLNTLYCWLEAHYAHVGVSQRAFNHTTTEACETVTRMNDVYAYNREVVLKSGARFDRLPVMEDFDMTLSLLAKGFPNIVTYQFCWSQRQSGESGGCSGYRTFDMQKKAAHQLAQLFPRCVRVIQKRSKVSWMNIGKMRYDVHILWKRAYKPKRTVSSATQFFGGK